MAQPKGYLSRTVTLNNPAYRVWENRPVGINDFERFTEVKILKPTSSEIKRLRQLANERNMDAFVVKLEGQRVFLTRDALLTPEEYNEARSNEAARSDDQKDRQRAKLALLKDRSRNMGQSDL